MNKVALCIAGQARAVRENFPCIERCILEPTQPDVFVHTWEAPSNDETSYPQDPEALLELYEPIMSFVEPPLVFEPHDFDAITHPTGDLLAWHFQRISSMFYSICRVNNFKSAEEVGRRLSYDWVIRLRTDVILEGVLDLDSCDSNAMYLHIHDLKKGPRCNDVFAFSNSANMDAYASCYPNMGRIMRETGHMSATNILDYQLKIVSGIEDIRESPILHKGFCREGRVSELINQDLSLGKVPVAK